MGADAPDQEDETTPALDTKGSAASESSAGIAVPRVGTTAINTTGITTATPLMSIQATPNLGSGYKSDFRIPVGTFANLGNGNRNIVQNLRQGTNMGCATKPQQPFQSLLNGTRPISQTHHLVTGSSSSSLFAHSSRPAQPMPLFPTQVNNTPNAGLLPTPPGFGFPAQNAAANDSGIGMHRSHSATVSLMQQFGLLQQQYQQTANGLHHYLTPYAHSNLSLNPMSFPVTPLSNTNQKPAHQSTFN